MKLFLKSLSRMYESSIAKYAYSQPNNRSVPAKRFAENCKNFADIIDRQSKQGTPYQQAILKSVARHIRNQNLILAQDVLDKLDLKTKNLIPKSILDFVSRNS